MGIGPVTALTAGRQLTPTLRLVGELQRGGMGSVWIADHATLKTQVAVKFLAERSLGMPGAIERFSQEASAAARVRSPHVVQVLDHGVSEGLPYIVMELLRGEDLAHRLERERVSIADTIAIVTQICKALERTHAEGIVHRDIKPGNVFLVDEGEADAATHVKVLDFGLAKDEGGLSDLTVSGAVFGTPHYLSPEQAGSARSVTPQSDLWSVAVIAYQCLTGERPYRGESLIELCAALAAGRFEPPTTLCAELPPAIDAWFVRAFQKKPSDRFASATELASTFATALSTPAEAAPPVAVPLAPERKMREVYTRIAIASAALALFGVVSWASLRDGARSSSADAPAAPPPSTSTARELAMTTRAIEPTTTKVDPSAVAQRDPTPVVALAKTPATPPVTKDAPRTRVRPTIAPAISAAPAIAASVTPPTDDLFSDPKR